MVQNKSPDDKRFFNFLKEQAKIIREQEFDKKQIYDLFRSIAYAMDDWCKHKKRNNDLSLNFNDAY